MIRAVLVLAVALLLTACGGTSTPAPVPAPETVTTPAAPAIVPLGVEHRFADGSATTVVAERYTLQASYPEYDGRPVVRLRVAVTNGTAAPVRPQVIWSVTSNGQPAEPRDFGGEDDITGPSGMLLPGQTQRHDRLVVVGDPAAELVVEARQPVARDAVGGEVAYFRGVAAG